MRKINAPHITEARFRGSKDLIVGQSGDINAGSKQELMARLVEIANMISANDLYTDVSHVEASEQTSMQVLAEAYSDAARWAELGSELADELNVRLLRDGFMRTFLDRGDLVDGAIPRIRVRTPNVTAIVSRGVAQNFPQFVRDRYIMVDEFTVSSNPRVLDLEMKQGSGDILEDKFYEAQEQILVQEDIVLVGLLKKAIGIYNAPTYFTGEFTPTIFQGMREAVTDWNIPAQQFLFGNSILSNLMVGTGFSTWFDPISKYEIVQTGRIGTLMGLNLITDGYREEKLKVIGTGEAFITAPPTYLGAYTDRGPVQSQPQDTYPDGIPSRGWSLYEHLSAVVANAKGVSYAVRQ